VFNSLALFLAFLPSPSATQPYAISASIGPSACLGNRQEALLEEAHTLLAEGRAKEALTRFESWVDRYPKDPRGYSGAASALVRLRRAPKATHLLREAHEIAPENVPVLFNLASCLQSQALYEEAIVHWRALRDLADVQPEIARRPDWIRLWGRAASKLERSPEAIDAFQRLIALDPENAMYRGEFANELLQATRFEEAVKELERVAAQRSGESIIRYQLGWAYLQVGQDKDAERELKAAVDIDPNLVDAHLKLGTLYTRAERFSEAIKSYQEALRANTLSVEALHAISRLYSRTGDPKKAAHARSEYERVSAISEERTEALRECLRGVAAAPRDVAAHEATVRFFLEQGDADGAEPWLLRLRALDPDSELALLNLSTILAVRGQLEDALLEVGKLIELDADHAQANLRSGRIMCAMRRWEDAIPYFEAALPGLGDARGEAETMLDVARRQARTNKR
jgi:tetratricopeptide (TPR) repeat protein